MKVFRWITACSVVAIFCTGWLEARTWTSASNGKTLEGELVKLEGKILEIKLANGKVIKAPLTAFSKADQEFVAKQSAPGADTKKVAAKAKPKLKPGDLEPISLEIWKIRTCCSKVKRRYEDAVKDVEGVTMTFTKNNNDDPIIAVEAKTKVAAREAMNKIALAGLYGETTSREVALKGEGSKAKGDMTATGVFLCCNKSADALKAVLSRSKGAGGDKKGVTEHTVKRSKDTFEIKGTATASEILRNARRAGFNFKLE